MPISVIFLGTSAFAVPSLKALAQDARFDVKLVITQPDRPVGRKQILTPSPVKVAALALGIAVEQPENINRDFLEAHRSKLTAHFLVVVSYGQILSQEILDLPLIAPINVHASLLPLLRGASPLQHTILQDMKESGVTVQKMMKELDAGPILGQKKYTLGTRETCVSLHDTLSQHGAELLVDVLSHPLHPVEQDHTKATHCKKLSKDDGIAHPTTMPAATIDRMVRALSPWPGVTINGQKILETSLEESAEALKVPCAKNTTLFVTRMQPQSGKPMTGKAFSQGHTL